MADGRLDNQVNDRGTGNPHPNPNQKKGRHRLSLILTLTLNPNPNQVKDRHRLTFLDPVTGTAVPCGPDGQVPCGHHPSPSPPNSSLAIAVTFTPPPAATHITPARTTTSRLRLTRTLSPETSP